MLEIGCGTGAVLRAINHGPSTHLFGVDIDQQSLQIAQVEAANSRLITGDGHRLPFANGAIDISFFHFVLLWLTDPVRALSQARRVTRPGGAVIAFAEPDYSQRVVRDPSLARLGQLQAASLRAQGADPNLGARLGDLFKAAGIQPVEFGQLQFDPSLMHDEAFDLELEVLKTDLAAMLPAEKLEKILADLHETKLDLVTLQVPIYYCWGYAG